MPSAGQILRARKRFATLLPDRATIQRPTTVYDCAGGSTDTWADVATAVPCRLSPVGGGEDEPSHGERLSAEADVLITFAAGMDIKDSDRITIGAQVFDVLLVRLRGEWELTRRCECKERD